ncbi:MAG: transketolase [Candidatus Omnitrophota bacterium]
MKKIFSDEELKQICLDIRKDILLMLEKAGSGHTGGSLSAVEILTALYFYKLKHNPKEPRWNDRDRFILSKGHACPALYAVLSKAGYFEREILWTLRKLGSKLQGHAQRNLNLGVEASTGSLGQGLSIANGIAMIAKKENKDFRVYCLMGDGETDEGQIWEAVMTSFHYSLDNLCAIVDHNKQQIDGWLKDVKNIEPLAGKWKAFGWHTIEVNGHDAAELKSAYDEAEMIKGRPSVIIAHTIKGKGVSFMENDVKWHGVAPKAEELKKALKELE